MSLQSGTRLGPYEVVAPVGSDGDDRYTATDTRAPKTVGIKVLPAGQPLSESARARLARDAKTISSLRHPHISAPVELGHEEPSIDFVVSEHADGETLAQRLSKGPLPLAESLQVAIAVADSLDKAHRRGVVHGVLSPSTVLLTANGPRLLDLGLAALASDIEGADPAASLTRAITGTVALGAAPPAAAAYVAPERWSGAAPDARGDIFACGALLYEMVTGRPAFQEKTQALLVAAIQSVDPDPVASLKPGVPAALDHVVRRCLERDPGQRLQTAWDLLIELKWITESGARAGVPVAGTSRTKAGDRLVWAAAAVAGAVAFALGPWAFAWLRPAPAPAAVQFTVSGLPSLAAIPITMSPDGRWVAGHDSAGSEIFGVSLGTLTPQRLVSSPEPQFQPFWSPDSRSMAFFGRGAGAILRADISGGPTQTVAEATPPVGNGTWNTNGVILFSGAGVIHRVLAAGGEPTPLTNLDEQEKPIIGEQHIGPWFLPDDRHFLYTAISSDSAIYLAELGSRTRTRLIAADSKAMYAAPGYILFNRGSSLFAQPFDATALALTGEPVRIADDVAMVPPAGATTNPGRSGNFAVSQTGALVYKRLRGGSTAGGAAPAAPAAGAGRVLVWMNRSGQETGEAGTGPIAGIDLARDGQRFAVHVHEGAGGDVWTFDPQQRRLQRFTFDAAQENSSPIWSPDGTKIAYASLRESQWGLYLRPTDGSGTETLVTASSARKSPMSWSPDGKWLVYVQDGKGLDVWAVPLDGDKKPVAVLESPAIETLPQVSPDGKWLAYQSNETGQLEVYVKQFPEGPAKRQMSTAGGTWPRWRGDGKELYFDSPGGITAVDVDTSGPSPRPGVPRTLFARTGTQNLENHNPLYHRYAVSPDGQRFLMSRPSGGRGATPGAGGGVDAAIRQLIDGRGGRGGAADQADIAVVLNWPQLVKARATAR